MTSLNDPVHQREIEEKKRGSGKRTVQIFKKKKKGMNMDQNTLFGVLIPFVGTTAGAACVFFLKNELKPIIQKTLLGFASGVMVAASIWSLLIPAIEQSEGMGKLSFLPAFVGFWVGVLFLLVLDHLIPHLHVGSDQAEGPKSRLGRTTMMVLAVTLHNIPEGMAVGVMYAGFLAGNAQITAASALVLSLGIAIQNFPEGAIISMPLRAEGESKGKAFLGGVLSGVVEPIGAVLTILAAQLVIPALPYFLSFAAGAMLYVVVEELIPEMSQGKHSNLGTIFFAAGFSVMMTLDVALG
jgi:ZIP family zinc transporter